MAELGSHTRVLTMPLQRQSNGQRITVTATLGTGGEARVCAVQQDQTLVAKLYHRPTDTHGRKLAAMLANPPLEPGTTPHHTLLVWPLDLLCTVDGSRQVVGFLMPRVTGMAPIIGFYNPRARRQQRPWFDYYRLHLAARNLAAAVHASHTHGYIIGDVNTTNTFVGDNALVTLVDTDSFQVRDPQNGFIYRCPVGTPEYTPSELQGRDFASVDRAPEHDLFGLAVLIFQLLMEGTHPFAGTFQGRGEPPPLAERIDVGWFPYGRQAAPNPSKTFFRRVLARWFRYGRQAVPYIPARNAPPFDVLHPTLQRLFVRCFIDGHTNPQARPDALTWRSALDEARDALMTCSANAQHRFGNHLRACPWCERTALLGGRDPFPSQQAVQRREHQQPDTPSRRVPPTPRTPTPPPRPTPTPPPPVHTPPRTVSPPPHTQTPSTRPTPALSPALVNSIGMQFVLIPAGTFLMGSDTPDAFDDEKPVHTVRLSKAFYLGTYAVTQGQWQAIMGTNPSRFKGDPNLPVETVSWDDVQGFIGQLNTREGGAKYRLPTEAEWEYAARAGTTTAYSFGGDPRQLSEYAWYGGNSGSKTHPVGQKKPNPWGLYDMHGNVWEWVQDWYGPYTAGTAVDPAGFPSGSNRVFRGGGWYLDAVICRSAYRFNDAPGYRLDNLGLRLLRTAP